MEKEQRLIKNHQFFTILFFASVFLIGLLLVTATHITPANAGFDAEVNFLQEPGRAIPSSIVDSSVVVPIGANFAIANDTGKDAVSGKPGVAFDGENFFIAWHQSPDIYGARVTQDGTVLDSPSIPISQGLNTTAKPPAVLFDGTNFIVIWFAARANVANEIYMARVTTDGTVLDPNGIRLTIGGNPKLRMADAAFDGTNFLVAWRTGFDNIRAARVTPNGINLDGGTGFLISQTGFYPSVAFDGTNYMVVWYYWGSNGLDIYGSRVTTDGKVLDPGGFVINDDPLGQTYPVITFNGTNYVVVWYDQRPDGSTRYGSAYGTRLSPDGVVLDDPPFMISKYARGDIPVMVVCGGTECLAVWSLEYDDFVAGANFRLSDVYGRRISPDGQVLDQHAIPVSTAYGHQFGPVIGYGNDHYLVAWNESTGREEIGSVYGQILQKQPMTKTDVAHFDTYSQSGNHAESQDENSSGTWIQEEAPVSNYTGKGVAFRKDNSYTFGDGIVYHYNGSQWLNEFTISQGRRFGAWATGPDDIWTCGWCRGFVHFDGISWSDKGCYGTEKNWGFATSLWGSNPTNLWAVASDGYLLKYRDDWKNWEILQTDVPYDLADIWGTAANNIYAVGERGTILHFDGTSWNELTGIPTIQTLNAIWGNGAGDIFAAGDWGAIIHYDGTTWTLQESGTNEHLFDLWGRNGNDVYAAGLGGTILHYDGSSWQAETTGTDQDLLGVWAAVEEDEGLYTIWAAGIGNIILKKTVATAGFTASPTSGAAPLTVAFTNTSTMPYTDSLWDFGDGITSTLPSPSNTYTTAGTYTVALSVSGPEGTDTVRRTNYITVYNPAKADFTASPTSGVAPLEVAFSNTSSGDFTDSLWDFGDGGTSTIPSPSHTYTTGGAYTVTLTVSVLGGTDTKSRTDCITVYNPAKADFTASPTSGAAPLEVTFSNTSSGDFSDSLWDFGDGGSSTLPSPSHTYTTGGAYTVTLTVSGLGGTDTKSRTNYITSYNAAKADFTASPTSGVAPLEVTFSNTSSGDFKDSLWSFGDGGTSTLPSPSHTYTTAGTYTVTLTVSGLGGTDTKSRTNYITVSRSTETDKGGCFIATAAYGSPFHSSIKIFQDFKDRYLMPSKLGRSFVSFYYKYSPLAAEFIAKHKAVKFLVRICLIPLVAFSYLMLKIEPIMIALMFFLIFSSLIFYRKRLNNFKQ